MLLRLFSFIHFGIHDDFPAAFAVPCVNFKGSQAVSDPLDLADPGNQIPEGGFFVAFLKGTKKPTCKGGLFYILGQELFLRVVFDCSLSSS
jgi:hypothetical protein